ncbi:MULTISPECIES: hypothetical protein [Streptosporangium]|uniref:Diadenosine tetraphosphate (Ap4A) HIT family hydrolase n=1 Tax=Streptosporangium brasiliense TaxID=47480 RepID=A0ABT9RMF7_9ACTN|nr:hypothetical protein [Streptosporangium brasiliense]MDP9870479.1 diadenosine tetraphosphate (Ap4A) HIT family hydrolase [Streptosporangium brasiliense]
MTYTTTSQTHADQADKHLTSAADVSCYQTESALDALRRAQVGTGHALLAIHQELTELRADLGELADIAAAVRELADAIGQQQPRRRWFRRTGAGR